MLVSVSTHRHEKFSNKYESGTMWLRIWYESFRTVEMVTTWCCTLVSFLFYHAVLQHLLWFPLLSNAGISWCSFMQWKFWCFLLFLFNLHQGISPSSWRICGVWSHLSHAVMPSLLRFLYLKSHLTIWTGEEEPYSLVIFNKRFTFLALYYKNRIGGVEEREYCNKNTDLSLAKLIIRRPL